jgi:UDP-N-acetylmuramate dehydrogenase
MAWYDDFRGRFESDVPLARLTWFGLGGPARRVAHPTDAQSLAQLLKLAASEGMPVKILGGGANVLVGDGGFDGLVIRLDDRRFQRVGIEDCTIRVGAGTDLMRLVKRCSRMGLAGLECLAGIPGTVGGAVRMNAGGRFGEISQSVESIEVARPDGTVQLIRRDEVGFAYRRSNLGDAVVTAATLRVTPGDPAEVFARYREIWDYKKKTQPMADHSAGCIFTNPPQGDSAGRLIDTAGLKGTRCGHAHVSEQHANFIVADRGARAAEVLELIGRVRDRVFDMHGTQLELEIDIW